MDVRCGSDPNARGLRRGAALAQMAIVGLAVCCSSPTGALRGADPDPPLSVLQETLGVATGPKIQFAELVHDFGKVVGGEVLRHAFAFTNAGDGVLELTDVHSTCGCTTSAGWSKRVEPGQRGTIPIELHTTGFNGPVTKPVTVKCNDTNQPTVVLQVKATVWRPIEITPPSANLRVVGDAVSNAVTVLRILNHEDTPLTLSEPESDQRAIAAELKTVQAGQIFELAVKAVPPLGAGNVFAKITLRTSSTHLPVLSISAWVTMQPAVTVLPPQIKVPPGPAASRFTRDVSIRGFAADPLKVSEPVVDLDGVEGRLTELQPGRLFTVQLTFPQGFELPAGRSGELKLQSNHPQFQVIRVPIVQTPPPAPAVRPPA